MDFTWNNNAEYFSENDLTNKYKKSICLPHTHFNTVKKSKE